MSLEKNISVELFPSEGIKVATANPGAFYSEELLDSLELNTWARSSLLLYYGNLGKK